MNSTLEQLKQDLNDPKLQPEYKLQQAMAIIDTQNDMLLDATMRITRVTKVLGEQSKTIRDIKELLAKALRMSDQHWPY